VNFDWQSSPCSTEICRLRLAAKDGWLTAVLCLCAVVSPFMAKADGAGRDDEICRLASSDRWLAHLRRGFAAVLGDGATSGLYFYNHVKLVNWRLRFAVKLERWRESCVSSLKEPPAPSAVGLGLTEQNSKSRGPTPWIGSQSDVGEIRSVSGWFVAEKPFQAILKFLACGIRRALVLAWRFT
jgi:hypothetical protein